MIRIEYISTKDFDRVSKIHSNPKYINWNYKMIDGEYRFYPPSNVVYDDIDDFSFDDEDEEFDLDYVLDKKEVPILSNLVEMVSIGEKWLDSNRFFPTNFRVLSDLEFNMKNISKNSGRLIRMDKYSKIKVKSSNKLIKSSELIYKELFNNSNYRLYKSNYSNSNIKLDKFINYEIPKIIEVLD